jgi:hypothetical protein
MSVYFYKKHWYVKVMINGLIYRPGRGYKTKEQAIKINEDLKKTAALIPFSASRPVGTSIHYSLKYKEKVLAHYTKDGIIKCFCCGERMIEFLTLDHINGGGSKDKIKTGSGQKFYRYLIQNNFPPELDLQILCFNCNCGKDRITGICPHRRTRIKHS